VKRKDCIKNYVYLRIEYVYNLTARGREFRSFAIPQCSFCWETALHRNALLNLAIREFQPKITFSSQKCDFLFFLHTPIQTQTHFYTLGLFHTKYPPFTPPPQAVPKLQCYTFSTVQLDPWERMRRNLLSQLHSRGDIRKQLSDFRCL
jgi:hypothetical protein